MAYMLCDRFHSGPFCSDNRLESTGPEKEDCIKKAWLECNLQMYKCRRDVIDTYNDRAGTYIANIPAFGDQQPLDDLQCFDVRCLDALLLCYCAGLSGMTCTVCGTDATGGVGIGGDDETLVENDIGTGVDIPELTTSSTDIPIPITYGTVFLTGNIIWISPARKHTRTTKVGKVTKRTNTWVLDMAVGLAEGVIGEVLRVWIGDTLVIDKKAAGTKTFNQELKDVGFSAKLWNGSEGQLLNPAMDDGYGKTPAYRGLSYLMIENYPVTTSTGAVPVVRVEVTTQTEKGGATWDQTDIAAELAQVDYVSGRILTREPDGIKVRNGSTETMIQAGFVDLADFTADGGILFHDGLTLNYVMADNYKHHFYIASDEAIGSMAALTTSDGEKTVIPIFAYDYDANNVYHFEVHPDSGEMEYVDVYAGEDYLGVWADRFGQRAAAVLIGGSGTTVDWATWSLYDDLARTVYDRNAGLTKQVVNLTAYDIAGEAELVNVLRIPETDDFVLFFTGAHEDYAVRVAYNDVGEAKWTAVLPALPDGNLTMSVGDTFCFMVGQTGYKMDLATGATEETYAASNAAPATLGVDQHYDVDEDRITYVTSDGLAYVYPNRVLGNEVALSYVLGSVLEKAGMTAQEYDFERLDNVLMDGYVVQGQQTAQVVFEELSEFFHFTICESSNGLTGAFVANPDEVNVDLDMSQSFVTQRGVEQAADMQYARVGYFDTDRDGALTYQTVNKDMIRDSDTVFQNYAGFQYAANIYTTATPARKSAEMSLLRRIQRLDSYNALLGPRYLAIDPMDLADFSTGERGRVRKVELDTSFAIKIETEKDDPDIFEDSPELYGVTLNPVNDTISSGKITTFPAMFTLPSPRYSGSAREVLIGQTSPDTSAAIQEQFTSGVTLQQWQSGEPSEEMMVGAVVTPPMNTKAHFATDRRSAMVIQFSKDATGKFVNATADDIYRSFTRNLLMVGRELLQFETAVVDGVDPTLVTFTGLHRGKWGTELSIKSHGENERVAYYSSDAVMIARVYEEAYKYGVLNGLVYDELAPDITRYARSHYKDISYMQWAVSSLQAWKQPEGVYLRSFTRSKNAPELLDNYEGVYTPEITGVVAPMYFILKAPFDEETFMAALLEGNVLQTQEQPSTNSYIHRLLTGFTGGSFIARYNDEHMLVDGVAEDDDIHVAVMMGRPPVEPPGEMLTTSFSTPVGFKVEGNADYAKYKSALWVE